MDTGELPESQLERLSQSLRTLARRLSADESTAEDLAQDAMVTALEQPPGKIVDLDSWLARVVRHLAYRQHRRNALRRDAERGSRELPSPSDEELDAKRQALRQLSEKILELPEPYGSVLELRYFEGRSRDEIAAQLGRSPEAVKKQLQRGLTRVRADLERSRQRAALDWGFLLLPLETSNPELAGADLESETLLDSKGGGALSWSLPGLGGLALVVSAMMVWAVMSLWRGDSEGTNELATTSPPPVAVDQAGGERGTSKELVASQPASGARTSVPVDVSELAVEATVEPTTFELRVRVRDQEGGPVAEVELFVLDNDYQRVASAFGDDGGAAQFVFEADLPGLWSERRGDVRALVYATAPGHASSFTYEVPLPWTSEVLVHLEGPAATLWGVVLDEEGAPLAGVEVEALAGGEPMFLDEAGFYRGPLIHNTTTDEDGFFEFLGLQRTNHLVAASLPGFVGGNWKEALSLETEVEREYVLTRGAEIVGEIRDVDGEALEGARVFVSRPPGDGGAPMAVTDTDGAFRLEGVPGDKRWLHAEHPTRPLIGAMTSIDLARGERFVWNTLLKPLDYMDIRVASEKGMAVSDPVVIAEALNWFRVPTRLEEGLYRLTYLPPPPNVLTVTTHEDVRAGAAPRLLHDLRLENQEIHVELPPPSWGWLEMELVAADGTPLPPSRLLITQTDTISRAEIEVARESGSVSTRMKPGRCRMVVASSFGVWGLGDFEIEPGVTLELGVLLAPQRRAVPVSAPSAELDGPWILEVTPEAKAARGFAAPLASFEDFPSSLDLWPGEYELRNGTTRHSIRVPAD